MLGLILCGGLSSRMGTDKGLLKIDASNWAKISMDKMMLLNINVALSVNPHQFNDYSKLFLSPRIIEDNTDLQVKGPLCGVLSTHIHYPKEDLFILACDMPLMDIQILRQLYTGYLSETSKDAFVFTNNGEAEPLCGIYKANGLSSILRLLKANLLERHSMKFIIEHINTLLIPLAEEQKKYFANINTHADLNGL